MLNSPEKIKYALRRMRRARHLTQEDVAQRCGVKRPAVARWESGCVAHLGIDKFYLLAKTLGVSMDELMKVFYGE